MGRPGRRKSKSKRQESITSASPTDAQSKSQPLPIEPTSVPTSKPVRRWFRWDIIKDHIATWMIYAVIVGPIVGPLIFGIFYVPCYRASLTPIEFTVDRRERIVKGSGENTQAYYLVWSKEGEVFCVTDTWSFLSFDSSDRYGKLHEGLQIRGKVAGWRIPFLSWYRNVVVVDPPR